MSLICRSEAAQLLAPTSADSLLISLHDLDIKPLSKLVEMISTALLLSQNIN